MYYLGPVSFDSQRLILFLIVILIAPIFVHAQEHQTGPAGQIRLESEEPETPHLHLLWESRYMLEGRDTLDGGGLLSAETEIAVDGFTLAPWYGNGWDSDYEEFNLAFVYGNSIGPADYYLALTHLQYLSDDADDEEFGAGIAFPLGDIIDLGVNAYYSRDAEGAFIEFSASRGFDLTDALSLTPRLAFGVNQGYYADGHDGANHIALFLEVAYELTEKIALSAYLAQTWAIDEDTGNAPDDALLNDFFWGGFGLTLRF